MTAPCVRDDPDETLRGLCLALRSSLLILARQEQPERARAYLIAIRWIEQAYDLKPARLGADEEER